MARGSVSVPGSKSVSNRALLLAALGRGPCRVRGLLMSDDTRVMLAALRAMGVACSWENSTGKAFPSYLTDPPSEDAVLLVTGSGGVLRKPDCELYMKNAGTATRFLTTAINLIHARDDDDAKQPARTIPVRLTGNARMQQRPIADLVEALNTYTDTEIEYASGKGCPPLDITPKPGGWRGGRIVLRANVSSQYVSSVLISATYAREPVRLELDTSDGAVCSRPYIDITLNLLKRFGVRCTEGPENVFAVAKGGFDNPEEFAIEGDASSASYPLALAAVTGGEVTVQNCGKGSLQGDAAFCKLLERMGCDVKQTETTTTVSGPKRGGLVAISQDVDMDTMTDLFMTLAAVAAVARGTTRIVNVANQRVKECNRIEAMVEELRKCGVQCSELEDGIEIQGNPNLVTDGRSGDAKIRAVIDPRDDHRLAMSFAVLAACVPGICIAEKSCVNKTYPVFWKHLSKKLNVKVVPYSGSNNGAQSKRPSPAAADTAGANKRSKKRSKT